MLSETKPDKKQWFVIVTKPKKEKLVSAQLSEMKIEHYLPLHRQQRIWHDRKKWVETPLFHSYLFVYTENRLRNKVFEAGNILKYICIAGKVAVISASEIERIKILCSYLGEIEIEKDTFRRGDEVEIVTGHFAGIKGQIITTDDKFKFRIAIPGLGSYATIEIDKEHVLKAIVNNK